MAPTREESLFCLRYAMRVLEANAQFWGLVAGTLKLISVVSGTAAFVGLIAGNAQLTLNLGVVFAVLQGLDLVIDPTSKKVASSIQRKDYALVWSKHSSFATDAELDAAYKAVIAEDEIKVTQPVREFAYNAVIDEYGLDPKAKYSVNWFWQLVLR